MNKASDLRSLADSILVPAVSVRSLVNPAMAHRPDANLRCVAEGAEVEWPCYSYRLGVLERHGIDPFGRNEVMLAHRPDIDWMCAEEHNEENDAVEWPCTSYRTAATEQYGPGALGLNRLMTNWLITYVVTSRREPWPAGLAFQRFVGWCREQTFAPSPRTPASYHR